MFGKRKKKRSVGAFLDDGSEIEGKYTCAGTVVLDARLRGEVSAKETLIVGEHGVLEATVRAATLVVHGTVSGNVFATECVELKASARVTGDIEAPLVVMQRGAVLDGRCRMTKEMAAETPHAAVVVPIKG